MTKTTPSKRIPRQNVVRGTSVVLTKKHPDLLWLRSDEVIIEEGDGLFYNRYLALSSSTQNYAPQLATQIATVTQSATKKDGTTLVIDAPMLSDIESIVYEEYYDAVTKIVKYKAIIKIRNSSSVKSNVAGVDARIYDPNSTDTTVSAAPASTFVTVKSAAITKVTWYNAQSVTNVLSGDSITSPYIVSNAQYYSDGSDVPGDSYSGSLTSKTKSVWRKTQLEALAAAVNEAVI